jgi:hypothetical protein
LNCREIREPELKEPKLISDARRTEIISVEEQRYGALSKRTRKRLPLQTKGGN